MKRPTKISCTGFFLLWFLLAQTVEAQVSSPLHKQLPKLSGVSKTIQQDQCSVIDINNLWLKVRNDGVIGYDSTKGWGMTYPMMLGGLLYCDNLVWVGKVKDNRLPEMRTGGGIYRAGVRPGVILSKGVPDDPNSMATRVFRIRRDYQTADLTPDAAGYFGVDISDITTEMLGALRTQYASDWNEWPWQKGAPFVDANGNGIMDPGDSPGLQHADQVAWFAYNDLDESACSGFAGGPSIGLEVQVTVWAYANIPILQDMIFKRYRIIYKGTTLADAGSVIDSMYLCQWVDPDIGSGVDDLGGCDSVLGLGYLYNSKTPDAVYKPLGVPTPGVGYAILQGPLVPGSQTDSGIFNFAGRTGVRNLPTTAFLLNATGDAISEPSYGSRTFWYWDVVRGFVPNSSPEVSTMAWCDKSGRTTKFMAAGDPLAGTGWIDGLGEIWSSSNHAAIGESMGPGDRRFMLSTGPFTMALNDTQEVVIAVMASPGADGPNNTAYLKYMMAILRGIYPALGEYVAGLTTDAERQPMGIPNNFTLKQNYPNPFNPSTRIEYGIPVDGSVKLAVYDVLGREVRVLQKGEQRAGEYTLNWDARDKMNNLLPSGVYFYRLEVGNFQATRKLILMR